MHELSVFLRFARCLDQKEIITVMGDMLKSDDPTPEVCFANSCCPLW